ncbi:LuxR family transcriptional regulator AbaR [Acinetobacter nosocomialis]|uniref:LuxR family transcriptional regulator n=1 Tax=Acinetobacter nosocomialis TaxID=106654 RepID=A0AB37CPQ9_ACINO|nr:LuxR family transcriptional regulator AbaR [Acinetobacter nosocomialis]SSQ34201.1 eR transcriptional regulator [Acinetobacter baumannii]MBD8352584.1 LuxR family transcriptional regulator AbaR [Acinetobacter nosocomialis]MBJ8495673.1 LuxR family transcriptional regulator AbaR [Acinetobacter nosocomialis]MBJ9724952.1 LuxR family transcriptional regulator AbaR [Acinetobacter nosocomialis]MBP1462221.1 LuxR family transcriptional regulator AbaR [Acinetobacter nosocomialis]
MESWQEDLLSAFLVVKNEDELFEVVKSTASKLGFDYCAYGMLSPLSIAEPKTIMLNNYPQAWQKRYIEQRYVKVDPTVQHCMVSLQPLVWSSQNAKTQEEKDFWEEARSYGLNVGWAQSSRDFIGTRGMLTLARSTDQLSEKEQKAQYTNMYWLTQTVHSNIAKIVNDVEFSQFNLYLTNREKEALRWTAEGKTSAEIAQIIGVTERTVNFHLCNSMQKLNVNNKISAAIRAVMLGLL